MSKKTSVLLAGFAAMAMASDPLMVMNPYSDLPHLSSRGGSRPERKAVLTNKQRKARAKSKKAKQSRKRNR
jgi:hypothetical protein